MTNRVRHLATSARKRNVVLVEAFFPLLLLVKGARDVRGVRAFRTTTRLVVRSWADPAPKHKGEGGRAYHIKRVVERKPGHLFHSTFRGGGPPDSTDFWITKRRADLL